uniref:Tachykinin-related peptide variant 2 n=3 Tax=Lygus hesperus TaxID=30085 RepID=A0A7T7VQ79_LYGHE|nr:tachykinin-related peptide precursor variant 2 [Lygus hesperus]
MRMSLESSVVLACLVAVCLCQERHPMDFIGSQVKMDGQPPAPDIEEFKRAPAMGFQGMRGKKDDGLATLSDADFDIEEFKRAPVMGFQGMRGKKAPQMGFSAMRGKKEDYGFWAGEEDHPGFYDPRGKKAPSGFFGMRGKKVPSAFFGMRGKKGPSGFMGVRGKKDGADDLDALMQIIRESASRQEMEDMLASRVRRFAVPTGLANPYQRPNDLELV